MSLRFATASVAATALACAAIAVAAETSGRVVGGSPPLPSSPAAVEESLCSTAPSPHDATKCVELATALAHFNRDINHLDALRQTLGIHEHALVVATAGMTNAHTPFDHQYLGLQLKQEALVLAQLMDKKNQLEQMISNVMRSP
jgi:hypothetical protein